MPRPDVDLPGRDSASRIATISRALGLPGDHAETRGLTLQPEAAGANSANDVPLVGGALCPDRLTNFTLRSKKASLPWSLKQNRRPATLRYDVTGIRLLARSILSR